MSTTISKASFDFLKKLSKNNNRDWFNTNKPIYQEHHGEMVNFAEDLLHMMNKHDDIETPNGKKSLHRIYRDTRFSKDKTPYKNHWSGGFKRATKLLRGGYYYHIEPGNSIIAGGFWGPESKDLKRIRTEIANDPDELRKIINSKSFKDTFGELHGTQLKSAPQGYTTDHPAIDLLRYKQFLVFRKFDDNDVLSPDFAKKANDTFKKMRPFFNYMSEVLTTDENGEPLF